MNRARVKSWLMGLTALYGFMVVGYAVYDTWFPPEDEAAHAPVFQTTLLPKQALAPDFTLPDLAGEPVRLADYRGRPVLIEFFATWCPHCQHSVPILKHLQETAPRLKILAINAGDGAGQASTAPGFARQFGIPYAILDYPPASLIQNYHVGAIPAFYLLDAAGHVLWTHQGALMPDQITQITDRLVSR